MRNEDKRMSLCNFDCFNCTLQDCCNDSSVRQEVLVKTQWGIEKTTYYTDDGCYFENYEDEDDVIAWTELPKWEE